VVLFVDAPSTRSFWPGLQNRRFATGLLPATNLAGLRNVAIVRCNNSEEIPRPVNRSGGRRPGDPRKPATPEHCLYQEPTSGVWLFGKSSRIYRSGSRGRAGADHTPWTVTEDLRFLLQDDWHSYTATEIAIARTGDWNKTDLATLTARLCDHTIAWDDRTLTPLPLHLAIRADLTHPSYRTQDDE
jgi:hypothetical protein